MKRQQLIYITAAVTAVFLLFFLGRTVPHKKDDHAGHNHSTEPLAPASSESVDFETLLKVSKQNLTSAQMAKVTELEKSALRGDEKNQQVHVFHQLAQFWKDSIHDFVPYAKYVAEASKLEKSEKNLTFAAHLFLGQLQVTEQETLKTWMAREAKELFEIALELNPNNDSSKVGLGSTYFFGAAGNEPPMKGIGLIREVLSKNPDNVFANYMLGVGSFTSGQWSKAVERFEKVVQLQPENLEVILRLADACEQSGDKANAKKWYQQFLQTVKALEVKKKFRSNPEMLNQIEQRIKEL